MDITLRLGFGQQFAHYSGILSSFISSHGEVDGVGGIKMTEDNGGRVRLMTGSAKGEERAKDFLLPP